MPDYETLLVDRPAPGVVLLALNRPEVLNAVNTRLGKELIDFFASALPGDGEARALVLTGAGERAFCVGADLKERHGMDDEVWRKQHDMFQRSHALHASCPLPVIAAVNGLALGGGSEMALTCDFIYASDDAVFGFPEVKRGIMPGMGGTQRLARVVGEPRAKELILTGESFSAADAHRWGMVNKVVPKTNVVAEAIEAAGRIAANAPLSIQAAKRVIHDGLQANLATGLTIELLAHQRLAASEDRREGIAAFNEGRPPEWRGR